MGDHSAIEWTDTTWNPIAGCTRVSAGCDNCYAAREAATRLKGTRQYEGLAVVTPSGRAAFNGTVRLLPERLEDPLRWRRPRRVFVNSMSDLFHDDVPDEFIDQVFGVMMVTPEHTYQVLTKRPLRMADYMAGLPIRAREALGDRWWFAALKLLRMKHQGHQRADTALEQHSERPEFPLPNVWLGVSVEDQESADERIPLLLETAAAVRWISAEPLLEPLDLERLRLDRDRLDALRGLRSEYLCPDGDGRAMYRDPVPLTPSLDWVVIGGESGPSARPFNLVWARGLRDQCRVARVPVFIKQLGARPLSSDPGEQSPAMSFAENTFRRQEWLKQYGAVPMLPKDRKGGDPTEWPEDLRVREWPKGATT